MNSVNSINFCQKTNALSRWTKSFSQILHVSFLWNEWNWDEVNHSTLSDGLEISNIIWSDKFKLRMFTWCNSNSTSCFDISTDFHFHLNSTFKYFLYNTNGFSIVEINHIIWFQMVLNEITIDSQVVSFRCQVMFSTSHFDCGTRSNSNFCFIVSELGNTNFSTSQLKHQSTVLVWSQSLCLFEFVYQFQIWLQSSMT